MEKFLSEQWGGTHMGFAKLVDTNLELKCPGLKSRRERERKKKKRKEKEKKKQQNKTKISGGGGGGGRRKEETRKQKWANGRRKEGGRGGGGGEERKKERKKERREKRSELKEAVYIHHSYSGLYTPVLQLFSRSGLIIDAHASCGFRLWKR